MVFKRSGLAVLWSLQEGHWCRRTKVSRINWASYELLPWASWSRLTSCWRHNTQPVTHYSILTNHLIPPSSRNFLCLKAIRIDYLLAEGVNSPLNWLLFNNTSRSNKLHSPRTRPHLWKFFSNPCRGPAPADPGYSKERRRRRGSGNNCLITL